MKTAEEIADIIYPNKNTLFKGMVEDYIKKYAKQKCKEQRQLCADFDGVDIDHTNYPEPEFD